MEVGDWNAFESLNAFVVVTDVAGGIVHLNALAALFLGRDVAALQALHVENVFAASCDQRKFGELVAAASRGERVSNVLVHCATANGTLRLVAWSGTSGPKSDDANARTAMLFFTGVDVTDAERGRELELEIVHQSLRGVVEHAPDAVFVADLDGRYTDVNQAGCRLLGCSRDWVVGRTIADLVPPEDLPRLADVHEQVLANEAQVAEWHLRHHDGHYVPVEVSTSVLPNGRWYGFVRDITERKAEEAERERLREQVEADSRWLRGMLETAPMGVLLVDPKGRISVNRRAQDLVGFEIHGERGTEQYRGRVFHPDGRPVAEGELATIRALRHGETVLGAEFVVENIDGHRTPLLVSAAPIRGADGRIMGGVTFFADLSERMRAEAAIRANERLLEAIFRLIPVAIRTTDRDGNLVRANPAAETLFEDVDGHGASAFGRGRARCADTGEAIRDDESALARALHKGEGTIGELIHLERNDGGVMTVIESALPLYDEAGARTGAVVVTEDVTSLKEVERELRRVVQCREEILGVVAHDLRGPVSAMLLQLDLLRPKRGEPERRSPRIVESLRRQADRMNRLIRDLLDVARIDAGQLCIELEAVAPERLLTEELEPMKAAATAASVTLEVETLGTLPEVRADRGRLAQVIENLVGNAIKFTPAGGTIVIGAAAREREVLFSVADTGPGIRTEDRDHVFDRFWQVRKTDQRGAGIGLTIAKGIIETHGGRIWIDSSPGKGTTFYFTVPTA